MAPVQGSNVVKDGNSVYVVVPYLILRCRRRWRSYVVICRSCAPSIATTSALPPHTRKLELAGPDLGVMVLLRLLRAVPLSGLVFILSGCEAPLPATPPNSVVVNPGDPWAEWLAIANAAPMDRDIERAVTLCSVLADSEAGLAPFVQFLGDPAVDPEKKIVAIICLTPQRHRLAPFEAQLSEWTATGQEETTRKLATHALGLLDSTSAMQRMKLLLDDPQRPVRETAMGVLLSFHPELVRERLQAFWDDPETSTAIREQVILGMPPHLVKPFIGLYSAAATDYRLTEASRMKSISVLGQLGSREHLAILRKCVDNDPDDGVKEQARGALALLEAAQGLAPVPQGQGVTENVATPPLPSDPPA